MKRSARDTTRDKAPSSGEVSDVLVGAAEEIGLGKGTDPASRTNAEQFAGAILRLANGGGRDIEDAYPQATRKLRRHNGILAAVVGLFGSGGVVASYYATVETAKSNAVRLDQNTERIDANSDAIGDIKTSVDDLTHGLKSQSDLQVEIKSGIDELKREKVDELKKRLDDARRELRRERRRRR